MSKVISAIIVAVILVGVAHVSMAAENPDQSMAALETIRSETALTEAKILLLEKQQKLEELRTGKRNTANTEGFKPMPIIPQSYGNIPPSMNLMPGGVGNTPVKVVNDVHDEVLGVVGVDGKYTATVRIGAGIYTVSQGDKISGGVVAIISLDKVVLKKAGKSVSIPFADQKS